MFTFLKKKDFSRNPFLLNSDYNFTTSKYVENEPNTHCWKLLLFNAIFRKGTKSRYRIEIIMLSFILLMDSWVRHTAAFQCRYVFIKTNSFTVLAIKLDNNILRIIIKNRITHLIFLKVIENTPHKKFCINLGSSWIE